MWSINKSVAMLEAPARQKRRNPTVICLQCPLQSDDVHRLDASGTLLFGAQKVRHQLAGLLQRQEVGTCSDLGYNGPKRARMSARCRHTLVTATAATALAMTVIIGTQGRLLTKRTSP